MPCTLRRKRKQGKKQSKKSSKRSSTSSSARSHGGDRKGLAVQTAIGGAPEGNPGFSNANESQGEEGGILIATKREERLSRAPAHELRYRMDDHQEPFNKAAKHLSMKLSTKSLRAISVTQEGNRLERHRKRQIPYDKPNELPVILQFPK